MPLIIDPERGRKIAELLYNAYSTTGIHGIKDMPEDIMPNGVARGSLDHIFFITLTVSIDYLRDAPSLWESARKTFEDPETRYLFNPKLLYESPSDKIIEDMQKYRLSKKPQKDTYIWRTVGITFYKKWEGNPYNFLKDCEWDSKCILERLKKETDLENGKAAFPNLRGPKIGPLWLRMLRDNVGVKLENLDKVPIPVDVHVARATLCTGVVRGQIRGELNKKIKSKIQEAWFESVKGLFVKNSPVIALDLDEPLWVLSKYGCSRRDNITGDCPVFDRCEAKEFCIKGKV